MLQSTTRKRVEAVHAQLRVDDGQRDRPPAPSCTCRAGWKIVPPLLRANSSRSSSVVAAGAGHGIRRRRSGDIARVAASLRASRMSGDERRAVVRASTGSRGCIAGAASGSGDFDADEAARLRPQLADRHREARERVHRRARHVGRQRREMELHVGPRRAGIGAREDAALVDAHRHRPARVAARSRAPIAQLVRHHDFSVSLVVIGFVQRKIMRACRWSCRFSPTPASAWTTGMPNSLQQRRAGRSPTAAAAAAIAARRRRRSLRAARRPRLAAALPVDDAASRAGRRTATRVACASVSTPRFARAARGPQVRDRGRAAQAAPGRQLVVAGAFLRRAVEVVVARNADLAGRGDERLDELVLRARCPTPTADHRRRAIRSRRGRCARACGSTAARRRSPSRGLPARPNGRSPRAGRGCRSGR